MTNLTIFTVGKMNEFNNLIQEKLSLSFIDFSLNFHFKFFFIIMITSKVLEQKQRLHIIPLIQLFSEYNSSYSDCKQLLVDTKLIQFYQGYCDHLT